MEKVFDQGINIFANYESFEFDYGTGCFGPQVEVRTLDAIRKSLLEPQCEGPSKVYSIAMDVGKENHQQQLIDQHLLFGLVTYAKGRLGKEPIRSQGHIHKTSVYANNWSTPEVYEIWSGKAVIYMQEYAKDHPGRCYAVIGEPGDVIIVPPFWAHATISADPDNPLTFGAWCDRDYGFDYDDVRAHKGLAFYPLLNDDNELEWQKNPHYKDQKLEIKKPRIYTEFDIDPTTPIYKQYVENNQKFEFVPRPDKYKEQWLNFIP
ncbi:glucose-6-phosphate isomerase family protein [Flammeovirga pacifica]|uniref:glucose-6-phosphate isomerase n=1 Tax=Flammeovirga pacifica TaxID=915059 RepID=A0A1S1YS40_FLAPC|nr:glucose-6-phosphate isomerase family protein [Flammeovirga pacifica]OHX63847.1 glucose-6-phosphate isomerase [Flammeovirga pacifica]